MLQERIEGHADSPDNRVRVSVWEDYRTMDIHLDLVRYDLPNHAKYAARFEGASITWVRIAEGDPYPTDVGVAIPREFAELVIQAIANAGVSGGAKIEKIERQNELISRIEGLLEEKDEHLQDMRFLLKLPKKDGSN